MFKPGGEKIDREREYKTIIIIGKNIFSKRPTCENLIVEELNKRSHHF